MRTFTTLFTLAAAAATASAADCAKIPPGAPNGECVKFYSKPGCNGLDTIGSFRPDCTGACFSFDSFTSIEASGDGFFGTNCFVYSDTSCQNEIGSTGNQVVFFGLGSCTTIEPLAKSMKCFYRC
jgi:hypothetical protein